MFQVSMARCDKMHSILTVHVVVNYWIHGRVEIAEAMGKHCKRRGNIILWNVFNELSVIQFNFEPIM